MWTTWVLRVMLAQSPWDTCLRKIRRLTVLFLAWQEMVCKQIIRKHCTLMMTFLNGLVEWPTWNTRRFTIVGMMTLIQIMVTVVYVGTRRVLVTCEQWIL